MVIIRNCKGTIQLLSHYTVLHHIDSKIILTAHFRRNLHAYGCLAVSHSTAERHSAMHRIDLRRLQDGSLEFFSFTLLQRVSAHHIYRCPGSTCKAEF